MFDPDFPEPHQDPPELADIYEIGSKKPKLSLTIINEHDGWIIHQQLEASAELGLPLHELGDEPDESIFDLDWDKDKEEE